MEVAKESAWSFEQLQIEKIPRSMNSEADLLSKADSHHEERKEPRVQTRYLNITTGWRLPYWKHTTEEITPEKRRQPPKPEGNQPSSLSSATTYTEEVTRCPYKNA